MDFDQAVAIVLFLRDRPQTDMTDELRRIQRRAWDLLSVRAEQGIAAEKAYLQALDAVIPARS